MPRNLQFFPHGRPQHCAPDGAPRSAAVCRIIIAAAALIGATALVGCVGGRRSVGIDVVGPPDARTLIDHALPAKVPDRALWVADIQAAFSAQGLPLTRPNVCAVAAVIEQESGFQVDPPVPDLPAIAWREIDGRAGRIGIPAAVVHGVLGLPSTDGRTYRERIDTARTEKQLSDVYEDFIARVPLGRTLFGGYNPIRTRGPMQVHVRFAEQFSAKTPYPYPIAASIEDEVFTRRGGVYFGVAHLLGYTAPYDRYLFRFADYNAGQFASRNAAFQRALARATGMPLAADGALVPGSDDAAAPGDTELALRSLAPTLHLGNAAMHAALENGRTADFADSVVYRRVFEIAEKSAHRTLPRAVTPVIELHGPKLKRRLTTDWYAHRVNERFERCLRAH